MAWARTAETSHIRLFFTAILYLQFCLSSQCTKSFRFPSSPVSATYLLMVMVMVHACPHLKAVHQLLDTGEQ